MDNYLLDLKTMITEKYDDFTQVEKTIADYFLMQPEDEDLSARAVAGRLYVSEASLSRFAQKLNFKGYREFLFSYEKNKEKNRLLDDLTRYVIHKYQNLLDKTYRIVDNHQLVRVAEMLSGCRRVYFYGEGFSALTAREFSYRFSRLGLDSDACGDANEIGINVSRIQDNAMVIGISVSGQTRSVIDGLKAAKKKKARTVLLTSSRNLSFHDFCDEVVLLPYEKNITISNIISPQFPPLVVLDMIYAHYLSKDYDDKMDKIQDTLKELGFLDESTGEEK